jgi:signal peptidase II
LFALDLWSKSAVFKFLADKPYFRYEVIPGWLNLLRRENSGAAFSMFAGQRFILVAIASVAFIGLIYVDMSGTFKKRFEFFILGMFAAGIAGNLYDRFFNDGNVRDFIDVNLQINDYHWPTFNVADSLLCIAVGLYLLLVVMQSFKKDDRNDSSDKGQSA